MNSLITFPSFLGQRDALLAISGIGLVAHLLFKRYEFGDPKTIVLLLGVVPAGLTTLLVPHHPNVLMAALISFVTYLGTLLLSIVLYRIAPYHPLAKYPGPFLNKLTKFRMVYITWTGKQHAYYARLHEQYGDIVRTGPNEVIVRDSAAILPLLGTTGWSKSSHWPARTLHAPIQPVIAIRDPLEHMRRRKPWTRGFSIAALKGYEPVVAKRVDQLIDKLIANKDYTDLSELIGYFAFDVMSDMAFGGGTEMIRDGDKDGLWHLIEGGMRTATLIGHVPWTVPFVKLWPGVGEDLKHFRAFGITQATRRRKEGSQMRDLFHYLADEDGVEKEPIPFPEIISDGALVIVAGSDTTATVITSLFYYLLANSAMYKRLQAEVDKFFGPGEQVTLEYMHEMTYLEACINEALRISPPIISGSPRSKFEPNPSEGKMLGPHYIPEGTTASINTLAVHRDPRNFNPQPTAFWPERWLIAQGLEPKPAGFVHDTTGFFPFSFGPGNCVGKPLAMLELRTTVLNIMHRVEMKFTPEYQQKLSWEEDLEDFFVVKKGALPVSCTPRLTK